MKPLEEYDSSKLLNNPFTYSLVIPVTKITSDLFKRLPPEIEGKEGTFIKSEYYTERLMSAKIYYSTGMKKLIAALTDKAQRLFLYILSHMERNKDYYQFNKQHYMTTNSIKSNTTVLAAIDELITTGFISNTMYKTVYWTNPIIFSSSNRVNKYPDNLDEKSELA
jgi:hypothetical protein